MSYHSRDKKKRFRTFRRIYEKGDIQFDQWELKQIHQVPEVIEINQEFDFWAKNNIDIYRVTFENSSQNEIVYLRDNPRSHIYIRVCTQFANLNIDTLKILFSVISTLGIPHKSIINESKHFTQEVINRSMKVG